MLCADNVIDYMRPSLERHRGCDLLDINPGAGVWSRKLHEAIQPRKHILMEKDATLYAPFLKDLTEKENVHLLDKSGIAWSDLSEVLQTQLQNQVEADRTAEPQRNDTLLVSVNLGFHPRKKYAFFDCVSDLVLYQFISSIRAGSIFQKYGLIRMLVWISDDGKRKLLPRSAVRRRRVAFDAELSCEWIHEVAGKDREVESDRELRDEWINMESGYNALARMKAAGLTMPSGRETHTYKTLMADQSLMGQQLAGSRRPLLNRPFWRELQALEAEYAVSPPETPIPKRLSSLRYREKYAVEDNSEHLALLQERDRIHSLVHTDPSLIPAADAAFTARLEKLKKNQRKEFILIHDNYHLFRQSPPVMFWDQRPFEPLNVLASDFFPNAELALLDIQPRAMHPLLREHGIGKSLGAHTSDIMLRYWLAHSLTPLSKALDGVWPGTSELVSQIPSLRDPALGGSPLTEQGELNVRSINAQQWADIMEAFMASPFRPSHAQLVARLGDDGENPYADDDDTKSGAMGAA